jgi:8-oxo-dGTP pyrophosphatase MutT (NUDIX family)
MDGLDLQNIAREYVRIFPSDKAKLEPLLAQIGAHEPLNDRDNFRGHITCAGMVVSPDLQKILLIHHNLHKLWLQPGGHLERDDKDPLEAARREVIEETGVAIARYVPINASIRLVPVDIGVHSVKANAARHEQDHYHYDFRYVFVASSEKLNYLPAEVSDARWFAFSAPETEHVAEVLKRISEYQLV